MKKKPITGKIKPSRIILRSSINERPRENGVTEVRLKSLHVKKIIKEKN